MFLRFDFYNLSNASFFQDNDSGLNVCLHCFNGGCTGERDHGLLHYKRFGHPLALNIRRTPKKVQVRLVPHCSPHDITQRLLLMGQQRDEPPPKISKLAITAETEEDRYDIVTSVTCYSCAQQDVDTTGGNLRSVIEGIMNAMTFSKREEVKAWEQEFVPCEHTLCLVQQEIEDADSKGIDFPDVVF